MLSVLPTPLSFWKQVCDCLVDAEISLTGVIRPAYGTGSGNGCSGYRGCLLLTWQALHLARNAISM